MSFATLQINAAILTSFLATADSIGTLGEDREGMCSHRLLQDLEMADLIYDSYALILTNKLSFCTTGPGCSKDG